MTLREFLTTVLGLSLEPARTPPPRSSAIPAPARRLPYVPGTVVYYTIDGRAAFRFSFEQQPNGEVKIFIHEQPSYEGRDEGSIPTHRLTHARRRYICFEPLPRTSEDCQKIAKAWAELTMRYIRTGQRFGPS